MSSTVNSEMYVVKRNGERQDVKFDKITVRIAKLCYGLDTKYCDPVKIAQKVISGLFSGVTTAQLDELAAQTVAYSATEHPDFSILAARLVVSNLHKSTSDSFSQTVSKLYHYVNPVNNRNIPLVSKELYDLSIKYKEEIEEAIDYKRDYTFDFFGFKTLERAYLIKIGNDVVERPQHLFMRVALGIHGSDIKLAIKTYDYLSLKYFIHATPTLFNAGTNRPQMASCFLLCTKDDSIQGIYDTISDCAKISKWAGGIGVSIHDIRAKGSYVSGTNGYSNGIVPMLRVFNDTARYVDQCFVGDTPVLTDNGWVPIRKLQTDSKVLTNDGTFRRVKCVVKHPFVGDILNIQTENGNTLVTHEHQVFLKDKFVDAKELSIGDSLTFCCSKNKPNETLLTENDCYMYGILFSNIRQSIILYDNQFFELSFKPKNDEIVQFIKDYLVETGTAYNHTYSDKAEFSFKPGKRFKFSMDSFFENIKHNLLLRRKFDTKFYNLGPIKTQAVLDGMIDSNSNDTEIINTLKHYLEPQTTQIQFISEQFYEGILYDLEVENPHTYITPLGVVHNGGGRRKGSFAMYLEPWHADIEDFLELRKNHGSEEHRARDLFYGLWIPDLFMERVENNSEWTLFCPNEAPGLSEVYGQDFVELYTKYEKEKKGRKTIKAVDLWYKILESQIETGTPYMLYKDACNEKSNQKNLGTIKSSNLCVSSDTKILARHGYESILELYNKGDNVEIWNGTQWSSVKIKKTGVDQKLLRVTFSNGIHIDCTEYHKFLINGFEDRIDAKDLKEGMQIKTYKNVMVSSNDSCQNPNTIPMYHTFIEKIKYAIVNLESYNNRHFGYYCASYIHLFYLSLGIHSVIKKDNEEYKIIIDKTEAYSRFESFKNGTLNTIFDANTIFVKSIKPLEGVHDTYCFNEPINHTGIFNGILTGNCTEIIEYTAPDETSVCNLASINLRKFIKITPGSKEYDFKELCETVKVITQNLNKVIDRGFYPIPEAKKSNFRHRPIGIGVQALADTFAELRMPFDSPEARQLNRDIFETIYFGAVSSSMELAVRDGPYETFKDSPMSKGIFQFDMWNQQPNPKLGWNWDQLRHDVMEHGVRNSLLVAPMPTASTSQILGNNECFEPYTSNIYTRRVLAGEFTIVNKHLMKDLLKRNLWTPELRNQIIRDRGSVQNTDIPQELKDLYKTVWEIKQRVVIDLAADRGAFIDQSQSMNIHLDDLTTGKLTSMHFYGWKKGLKTGMYYLRTRPKANAIQFTVEDEECLACGS